jgi:hypothetical protein
MITSILSILQAIQSPLPAVKNTLNNRTKLYYVIIQDKDAYQISVEYPQSNVRKVPKTDSFNSSRGMI